MGLREVILVAIAVLAAYVGYQLYRAARIGSGKAGGPVTPRPGEAADAENEGEPLAFERPRVPREETASADAAGDAFQFELELRQLRREFEQQQAELAALRRLVDELGAALRAYKEQAATRGASPEYNEALVCARRGWDVEAIAERCGITVAEAELVQALARSQAGEGGKAP